MLNNRGSVNRMTDRSWREEDGMEGTHLFQRSSAIPLGEKQICLQKEGRHTRGRLRCIAIMSLHLQQLEDRLPLLHQNAKREQFQHFHNIAGIGISGQMHGLVALDEHDHVIRPAILWNDGRTFKEVDYLNNVVGKDRLSELTANIAFAGFTAPKLLWMRENEPENFKKIAKIMLPKDYVTCLLYTSPSPRD